MPLNPFTMASATTGIAGFPTIQSVSFPHKCHTGDHRVVAGLGLAVQGCALLLQVQLLLLEGLQLPAQVLRLPVQGVASGLMLRHLLPYPDLGFMQLPGQILPAAAVAVQVRHQLAQVRQAALRSLALGGQGGLLLLAAGDPVGDAAGFRLQVALPGQAVLGLLAQLPGQVLLTIDLRLKLPAAGVTVRRLPGQPEVFGVHCGWIIVLVLVVVMHLYMNYTKHGYEIAVIGDSSNTARYAGMNVGRIMMRTMFLSGSISGLVGFIIVSGANHTLYDGVAGGVGFTAISVAWLAQLNPFAMIIIASMLAVLTSRCFRKYSVWCRVCVPGRRG